VSFAKTYFDNKELAQLKKTITPNWDDTNTQNHINLLGIPKSAKVVLEIGCGIGRLLKEIQALPQVDTCYGVDASGNMIDQAADYCDSNDIHCSLCDGNGDFDLPPEPVDFAFAWLVFQHIDHTKVVHTYCKNMVSTLRPGGTIKCQLLRHNERPGNPLWVWHDPHELASVMYACDCVKTSVENLSQRWVLVTGVKDEQ